MENVCDKKDCPLYMSFFDPMNYKPFKKIYMDTVNKYSKKSDIEAWVERTSTKIKTTCLACQHFNKIDMYTLCLAEEAKKTLIE